MCESILNLDKQFRRCHLKKKFTGGRLKRPSDKDQSQKLTFKN